MGSDSSTRKPDIICFGDSLTVGYQSPTADVPEYRETPYGDFLQNQLGKTTCVVISGLCGELTAEMVERFTCDVVDRSPRYVVILGGTNDLGWNLPPSDIFHNLALMYNQAQAEGITPIAVTVPSLRPLELMDSAGSSERQLANTPEWHMIRAHIDRRLELNRRMLDYCASKRMAYVDLFSETAEPDSKLLALPFSNDGLHLSTRGYERLADLLWNQIFKERYNAESSKLKD